MTFGWSQASTPVDDQVAKDMIGRFVLLGGVELDTARIYSGGESEEIIGRILAGVAGHEKLHLGTKAHPSQPGGLGAEGLRAQLKASFQAMNVDRMGILYLHQPDQQHSLVETLECAHAMVQEGLVGALGLSNYSALETERLLTLCDEKGWTKPSVFQGLYNPVNRKVEEEEAEEALRRTERPCGTCSSCGSRGCCASWNAWSGSG